MAVLKFSKRKKKINAKKTKARVVKKKAAKARIVKKRAIKTKARRVIKKAVARKSPKKIVRAKQLNVPKTAVIPGEKFIGKVTHYFPKVRAAVVKVEKGELNMGDKIHLKGHTSDFSQIVKSMQIDRAPITSAKNGDEIGMAVISRVRRHDDLYKIL